MTPPFDLDVRDADFTITEGRKRLRSSAPSLTPEQVTAWLADVARRGGTVRLSIDGLVATYDRDPVRLVGAEREAALATLDGGRP